jgi:hypothetical protein
MLRLPRLTRNNGYRLTLRTRLGAGAGVVAVTGFGVAAMAGAFAPAASAQTAGHASAAAAARPAAGVVRPLSAAMINAVGSGNSTRIAPVAADIAARQPGAAAAQHAALAWVARPGSRVLGESLVYASTLRFGPHQLVWLVSLDPAGGLHSVSGPPRTANFVVAVVSAKTGQWLMTAAGLSPALPALPAIPAR